MAKTGEHTIAYEGEAGRIILTVPWGFQSGNIPPPVIKFYVPAARAELTFAYVDCDEDGA